jgi:hypothetical protein
MSGAQEPRHVDMQSVSDETAGIYEAIATLEHSGQRPTPEAIAAATGVPRQELEDRLARMTDQGMVVVQESSSENHWYAPASRGWSAAPDEARGQRSS